MVFFFACALRIFFFVHFAANHFNMCAYFKVLLLLFFLSALLKCVFQGGIWEKKIRPSESSGCICNVTSGQTYYFNKLLINLQLTLSSEFKYFRALSYRNFSIFFSSFRFIEWRGEKKVSAFTTWPEIETEKFWKDGKEKKTFGLVLE